MTQLRLPFELLMACLYCNYVEHGPEKWLQNHPTGRSLRVPLGCDHEPATDTYSLQQ